MNCSDPSYASNADLTLALKGAVTPAQINSFWYLINAEIVFLMQIGFMMLEVGSVRAQHAKAICVKNVVNFLIVSASPHRHGTP